MGTFNYDKNKFKDVEGLDELLDQAIKFGTSQSETKAKDIEKTYQEKMNELETQLNGIKNEAALEKALSEVPEQNRGIIAKLINNDPSKIDEVKKEYSQLFEKSKTINLADVLNGNLPNQNHVKTGEQLEQAFRSGATLTKDEEVAMWDYIANKKK